MNSYERKAARHVADARAIWKQADDEGRNLTLQERRAVERHLDTVESLKAMGRLDPGLPGGGAVTMTDPRAVGGEGWAALAKQIDVKAGKVKAEGPLAGLMRTKTLTGGTDPAGFDPVRAPLAALGSDSRFLYVRR